MLWLVIGALVVCALALGSRGLWAPDEPRYALVAREMIESGNWLIPYLNGEAYSHKPPLFFWLIALSSFLTGGVGQAAAIFPSLLALAATLLATARLAFLLDRGKQPLVPVLAVGLLAISYRIVAQATVGQIDLLLTALETWAVVLLLEALWLERDHPRVWLCAAFALMGAGILAKGPVALICPLGGVLVGLHLAGERSSWRKLFHPLPWLILLAVVGAWLIPAAILALKTGQQAWLEDLLFRQNVTRMVASWHHHRPPYYLWIVPWHDFLPGILLLIPAAARLIRPGERGRPTAWLLMAGACLFILVFFSIPTGKRAVYIVPLYPLLSCWLAMDLAERLREGGRRMLPVRLLSTALGLAFLVAAVMVPVELLPRLAEREIALGLWPLIPALAALVVAHLGLGIWPRRRMLLGVAVAWGLFHAALLAGILPRFDDLKSAEPFVERIRETTRPEATGAMVDFRARFAYHGGQLVTAVPEDPESMGALAARLISDEPMWVIVQDWHLDSLVESLPPGSSVCRVFDQPVGGKVYILVANEAALRSAPGDARGR